MLRVASAGASLVSSYQAILTQGDQYRTTGWARSDGVGIGIPKISTGGVVWTGTNSTDWQYFDEVFLLDPFTTIILTSDGIVEAQNEAGEMFGFDRLEATILDVVGKHGAAEIAEHIIDSAQHFMGAAEQHDDMTVVVVVKT